MARFSHFQKSVPLPIEFINKYMVKANATYVKVYIYALAQCYENRDMTDAEIAEALDILETDVSKAWKYWKRVGLVHSETRGSIVFDSVPTNEKTEKAEPSDNKNTARKAETDENVIQTKELQKEQTKEISMKDIENAMKINPEIKDIISMAEQMLKRTLSRRDISALYNFSDWYGMSKEMILLLLEYCVTAEKTNFAYMEKIAAKWNENGINTLDLASKELAKAEKENRMISKCRRIFGTDRAFTASEITYITTWINEYSVTESLIKAAYERTVNNTGKLSLPYMNTILKSWHQKGIKNVSQIAEKENTKTPKSDFKKSQQGAYELDDMAALERKRRLAKQNS